MDFTDATAWTFAQRTRGHMPHFNIAIPDSHQLSAQPHDGAAGFSSAAQPEHADGCLITGIIDQLPEQEEFDFGRYGFEELHYAMARSMGISANEQRLRFQREWVDRGKNCQVLVLQFAKEGSSDLVFRLQPICRHLGEHIRLEVRDGAAAARHASIAAHMLAKSLELTDAPRSELVCELLRAQSERVDVATYTGVCTSLFALLNRSRDLHHAANIRAYELTAAKPTTRGLMDVVVGGLEECGERMLPYIEAATEGLEAQRRLGADAVDVLAMSEPLLALLGIVLVRFEPEGPEEEAYMREHGAIEVPDRFWEISDRFDAAVAGLG